MIYMEVLNIILNIISYRIKIFKIEENNIWYIVMN